MSGDLHSLNQAILCISENLQVFAGDLDALMVAGIDNDFFAIGSVVQPGDDGQANSMGGMIGRKRIGGGMRDGITQLAGYIYIQRAAQGYIDELDSAADPNKGDGPLHDAGEQL
jgi:hypothetical protein